MQNPILEEVSQDKDKMNSLKIDSVTTNAKGRNSNIPIINPLVNTFSSKDSRNADIEL